jgi:DNA-binding NarL/FixJ family response regulator
MHTVVLADERPVVLRGLEGFFGGQGSFQIVARCLDGHAALRSIRDSKPDLAVVDIDMPGVSGLDVLNAVMSDALSTRVVLLTESPAHPQLGHALREGAWGIMSKAAGAGEMVQCLREVAEGQRSFAWGRVDLVPQRAAARHDEPPAAALTAREREIALLVAFGMPNKQIAQHISVSADTVKIHLSNIFQKLRLKNRTSLAAMALGHAKGMQSAGRASPRVAGRSAPSSRATAELG